MIGSVARARALAGGNTPPKPPVKASGWIPNKRPDCAYYLGYWICAVCSKNGFDLREHFCNK
jgi:hypothetical protein